MVERRKDLIVVENQRTDLEEVFHKDLNIPKTFTLTEQDQKQFGEILGELANSGVNKSEGGVRALLGSNHFPLRKSLFTAFALSVSLTGSIMALIAAPPAGAVALTGTVLAAIERRNSLLTKLDATELVVYNELATLTQNGPKGTGYTAAELEHEFQKQGDAPLDVEGTLSVLREKHIVKFRATNRAIEHWVEW